MATTALTRQRCRHHSAREAVCRCPGCRSYFCRECVTDHAGRLLCRRCLESGKSAAGSRTGLAAALRWGAGALAGCLFAWAVFYYIGDVLASLPASFHGGDSQ